MDDREKKFWLIMLVVMLVVTAMAVGSSFFSSFSSSNINVPADKNNLKDFSSNWKNGEGIIMNVNGMINTDRNFSEEEPLIITKTEKFASEGESIYLHSRNLVINIYCDDVLLHKTIDSGIIKGVPGFDNYILSEVPGSGSKEIKLEIYRTKYSGGAGVGTFVIGPEERIINNVLLTSFLPVVTGVLFITIGAALIIFGIFTRKRLDSWLSSVFYGLFLLFISLGIMFDTPSAHLLLNNIIYVENSQRIFLSASLPAFLMFIDTFFVSEHVYPVKIISSLSALGFLVIVILAMAGVTTFIDIGFYYLVFAAVCGCITVEELFVFMIKTHCSGTPRKRRDYVSVYIFIACVLTDIIIYLGTPAGNNDLMFSCLGLYVISGFTLVSRFTELLDMVKLGVQAGKIGKIAFTDANTGIGNVAAFKSAFDDFESKKYTYRYIGIVQFDVNNLKVINDSKGHEAGDLLIKTAANIINKSFGTIGTCYRTGGDEFVALFSGDHAPIEFEDAINKFNRAIDKFNANQDRPFDLRIAHGVAYYQNDKTTNATLKEIHKIADERMYNNKRALKARYAKTPEEAVVR